MSNLSANAQLLGNLEHTTAELLEGMTEERGRGFASDNESWAALKGYLERAEKMRKDIEKVHKEMWDAIKDQNDDAYRALANELTRASTVLKDNPICEPVIEMDESGHYAISMADGKKYPVYEVQNGLITVKDKQYPIKLADGFYIIRKLTVRECMRLQTVPETYAFPVSDSQAYKMLGNGWTVDVIAHIMSHFDGLTKEPVEVLSMYDGMSCGHIALDKLGAAVTAYYATEIDKYAVQTTQHNFPDTVQLGDAFQVRAEDWNLPELAEMEAPTNG